MKTNTNMNVETMLDELKAVTPEASSFSSVEDFKKTFFEKADALPARPPRRVSWLVLKWATSLAAMFVIAVGGFFFYADNHVQVHEPKPEFLLHADPGEGVKEKNNRRTMVCEPPKKMSKASSQSARRVMQDSEIRRLLKCAQEPMRCAPPVACAPAAACVSEVAPLPPQAPTFNTEEYKGIEANSFLSAKEQSLSTFGADVDTASYVNARRYLTLMNRLPPKDAVRIEEFVNYFSYDYAAPKGKDKFGTTFEMMACPWAKDHQLLLIGLQAKKTDVQKLPKSNFVFLVDNSGSMYDSMNLVIEAMTLLAQQLREGDTVSLVTYGGGVKVLLDGAQASDKATIIATLQKLKSGGYTSGGAGIQEAYKLAKKHFIKKGNNRVVLITDGDFNVGVSSEGELIRLIEEKRKSNVYLSVFGVGYGNYKDNKLKMLANKGNGNYTYLDNLREAKNAMVNEYSGGMFALARDVKLQVEFNPKKVAAYRLLGYELRKMANRDFRDDTKDAGEVGVGHQVTALYELVMADAPAKVRAKVLPNEQALKYQKVQATASEDILTFRLRARDIEGDAPAREKEFVLKAKPSASANLAWAACAAEFALLLQDSPYKGKADYTALRARAVKLLGNDESGERAEFLTLVRAAADLK